MSGGHNTYLEDYLDHISDLPMDLTRKFTLMRDLDKRTRDIVMNVEHETRSLTSTLRKDPHPYRNSARLASSSAAGQDDTTKGSGKDASSSSSSSSSSSAAAAAASSSSSSSTATTSTSSSSSSSSSSGPAGRETGGKKAIEDDPSYQQIRRLLQECVTLGDEKVALATQTYEMVDKHIRRLDEDLKRFATDLALDEAEAAGVDAGAARTAEELIRDTRERMKRERIDMRHTSALHNKVRGEKAARKKHKANSRAAHDAAMTVAGASAAAAASARPTGLDLEIDPNEPTYCTCGRVSYGSMIACDNARCNIEWFHLECIGLSAPPKGKWFCTECTQLKRQGRL